MEWVDFSCIQGRSETEYMGSEWMECIRASVEEAKNNEMYAWLYDEDRWPSGTAGKVPCRK